MSLVLEQVIAQSNIAFAQSFVSVMQRSFNIKRIAIGIDNRPSSPQMAAACAGPLEAITNGVKG